MVGKIHAKTFGLFGIILRGRLGIEWKKPPGANLKELSGETFFEKDFNDRAPADIPQTQYEDVSAQCERSCAFFGFPSGSKKSKRFEFSDFSFRFDLVFRRIGK
jgi:hypothetical protein